MNFQELIRSNLIFKAFVIDLSKIKIDENTNVLKADFEGNYILNKKDKSETDENRIVESSIIDFFLVKYKNSKKDLYIEDLPDGTPGQFLFLLNNTKYKLKFKKNDDITKVNKKFEGIYVKKEHTFDEGSFAIVLYDEIISDGATSIFSWRLLY